MNNRIQTSLRLAIGIVAYFGLLAGMVILHGGYPTHLIDPFPWGFMLVSLALTIVGMRAWPTVLSVFRGNAGTDSETDNGVIAGIGRRLWFWAGMLLIIALSNLFANIRNERAIAFAVFLACMSILVTLMIRLTLIFPLRLIAVSQHRESDQESAKTDQSDRAGAKIASVAWIGFPLLLFAPSLAYFTGIDDFSHMVLDAGAFLAVVLAWLALALSTLGFRGLGRIITGTKGTASRRQKAFNILGWMGIEAGVSGLIAKLIVMLSILSDPSGIMYNLGLALLFPLYGLLLAGNCFLLARR
jgi:hypothetical protein